MLDSEDHRPMTCRDEILAAARDLSAGSSNGEFMLKGVLKYMFAGRTTYKESTIRTHVTSRMCGNAPDNHGTTYSDFERVGPGTYKLVRK